MLVVLVVVLMVVCLPPSLSSLFSLLFLSLSRAHTHSLRVCLCVCVCVCVVVVVVGDQSQPITMLGRLTVADVRRAQRLRVEIVFVERESHFSSLLAFDRG